MATKLEEKKEVRLMPMYKVIVHNDSVNSMDHVVLCLLDVFKMEPQQAVGIMLEAHRTGAALCQVEPMEPAELHRDQLVAYSLTATIEPDR
jgi:ATP-dependent Clp protease adaptor protein ClpS